MKSGSRMRTRHLTNKYINKKALKKNYLKRY